MATSTTHAVLRRYGMHRLAWLDRPAGERIRRYERDHPGELVHVDADVDVASSALAAAGARTDAAQPNN